MPIDIVNFRGEEELAVLRDSQEARFDTRKVNVDKLLDPESTSTEELSLVDAVIKLDNIWKTKQYDMEMGRAELGKLNKTMAEKAKKKEDFSAEKALSVEKRQALTDLEATVPTIRAALDKYQAIVGNLVHPTVPRYNDEAFNTIERTWGTPSMKKTNLHHHQLLEMIDGYEAMRGVNVAGHRAYFLKGVGVMLNQALIQHGLSFLRKKQYTPLQPPYFMKKEVMAATAQLEQFDEELYKVQGEVSLLYSFSHKRNLLHSFSLDHILIYSLIPLTISHLYIFF